MDPRRQLEGRQLPTLDLWCIFTICVCRCKAPDINSNLFIQTSMIYLSKCQIDTSGYRCHAVSFTFNDSVQTLYTTIILHQADLRSNNRLSQHTPRSHHFLLVFEDQEDFPTPV